VGFDKLLEKKRFKSLEISEKVLPVLDFFVNKGVGTQVFGSTLTRSFLATQHRWLRPITFCR